MSTKTTNYNLVKPASNETADIAVINSNMDILDAKLKEVDNNVSNITIPVTKVNNKVGDVVLSASDIKTAAGVTIESELVDKAKQTDVDAINIKLTDYNSYASSADSNGIYTVVDYKRADGTLYMKSTLSGGTSPNYTTDTWKFYDTAGTTVILTKTWTITYDANGKITSKVVA